MKNKEILDRLYSAYVCIDGSTKDDLRFLLRDATNAIAEFKTELME